MIDSLYIGATGMNAQQLNIDTVANNLANVNTSGFKRSRTEFADLVYRTVDLAGAANGGRGATGRMGMGTMVSGSAKLFAAGEAKKTGETFDLAVNGAGFFEVVLPDGNLAYTRNGAFRLDRDGFLATQDGYRLSAQVQLSPDAQQVRIAADGGVFAKLPNETSETELAHIELASFANPAGLSSLGDNVFGATDQSGTATLGTAGANGLGQIQQGFLEGSNVRLIDELLGLILAQRAYELNAKVVQASDELLGMANNLRR
jgi:flagellar basal-body rod protein FlgG